MRVIRAAAGNESHKDWQSHWKQGSKGGLAWHIMGGIFAQTNHSCTRFSWKKKELLKSVYNARGAPQLAGVKKLYAKCAFNSLVVARRGVRGRL